MRRYPAFLTLFALSACTGSPTPTLEKDKETLVRELQAKFDAIGPFQAELEMEGVPLAEGKGNHVVFLAADLRARRLHLGERESGGGPMRWKTHVQGPDVYFCEGPTPIKVEYQLMLDVALRMFYAIDRKTEQLHGETPEYATFEEFLKSVRYSMYLRVNPPEKDDGRPSLSVGIGFSGTGECGWLKEVLSDPAITGRETPDGVLWLYPDGRRVLMDCESGFLKRIQLPMTAKPPIRLVIRRFVRAPLPADAVPPKEYQSRQVSHEETAKLLQSLMSESYESWLRELASADQFDPADAQSFLGFLAACEWQTMRIQLDREWLQQYVDASLKHGNTMETMRANRRQVVDSYRTWKKEAETKGREWLRESLASIKESRQQDLKKAMGGSRHLPALERLLEESYRPENAESIAPLVPLPSVEDLLEEALRLASHTDSGDANSYDASGVAKFKKGDLEGAIVDLTRALEIDPGLVLAYYHRGLAKKQKGDLDAAIADYTRALEIDWASSFPMIFPSVLVRFAEESFD